MHHQTATISFPYARPRLSAARAAGIVWCLLASASLVSGLASAQTVTTVSATPHFSDTAEQSGIRFAGIASHTSRKYLLETMGSGVAVFDYDNDGLLDVLLINGAPILDPSPKGTIPKKSGPRDWNRLYHQKKDGTFEDVTEHSGLQGTGYGQGVAIGDYDNDGFEDVFVTEYGGNHLYHNNGNGTFTDVTVASGTGGSTKPGEGWSTSAAWVDLDNDGQLDLIVLRYVHWDFEDVWCGEHREGYRAYCHPDIFPAIAPLVYHNNGNGTFTEEAEKIGMGFPGKGLGLAINDFDRDGKIDAAVANDSMPEFLFHNLGGGQMHEMGLEAEIAVDGDGRTYAGMGIDFQDYDNDGLPDLVITNLANQKYALYRNNGDSSFTYETYASGLAKSTLLHSGWGIHFLDYDNDGLKDLLVAQGHDLDTIELNFPQLRYKEPMLLLHNTGRSFVDVSKSAGAVFEQNWVGRGMAVGDLDNDGRLDAVVSTNGGPAHLLHNETARGNHWITLNLVGHRSNRDAIGAQVKVTAGTAVQYATVSTCGSYLSANDKRVHFGLGGQAEASAIEIRWPSGIVQTLEHVPGDRVVRIDEPETIGETKRKELTGDSQFAFSDKPGFAVAGIVDYTAVGGHGSDQTLRTSEDLTRETLAQPAHTAGGQRPRSNASATHASEQESAFRAAFASAPDSYAAAHALGEFYLGSARFAEAVPVLERASSLHQGAAPDEYAVALACRGVGDARQARQHVTRALAQDDQAAFHRLEAELDEALGDAVSAVAQYQRATELDPSEANYFAWGSELLEHRAIWQASEVFERGTQHHPVSVRLKTGWAAALFAGARYEEAARQLCAASDLDPADREPYLMMSKVMQGSTAPLSCITPRLSRFVALRPADAEANYDEAMSLLKQEATGKSGKAEELLRKAVALNPKLAAAYLQLGILASGGQRQREAVADFEEAIAADPQLAEAHYRLGVLYARAGKTDESRRELALHDTLIKAQAEIVEQQRRQVKQFVVTPGVAPSTPPAS